MRRFHPMALLGALALLAPTAVGRAEPLPGLARGAGDLDVSGDGRFGLFAGRRELVVWELATGRRTQRVPIASGPWEIHASPHGETALLVGKAHLVEVQLLTGRVVADLPRLAAPDGAREVAWAPDGHAVVILGWELPELVAGEGTPVAHFQAALGFVERQIRIPGLAETRGMAVGADGVSVVVGTPRGLLWVGAFEVRTSKVETSPDFRVVTWVPDGVVVVRAGGVEVLDEEGRRVRSVGVNPLAGATVASRPMGRWAVLEREKPRTIEVLDLASGVVELLPSVGPTIPRAVLPWMNGWVSMGKSAEIVTRAGWPAPK